MTGNQRTREGGFTKEEMNTTSLAIISINSLKSQFVDSDDLERSNKASRRVVITTFKSPLARILIDTGESYSVISADFSGRLKRGGLRIEGY